MTLQTRYHTSASPHFAKATCGRPPACPCSFGFGEVLRRSLGEVELQLLNPAFIIPAPKKCFMLTSYSLMMDPAIMVNLEISVNDSTSTRVEQYFRPKISDH